MFAGNGRAARGAESRVANPGPDHGHVSSGVSKLLRARSSHDGPKDGGTECMGARSAKMVQARPRFVGPTCTLDVILITRAP
jgi:hypothetical protein